MSMERVPFRLLVTPCCGTTLCWVNSRLPTYCPECGKHIYPEVKSCVSFRDDDARLHINIQKPYTALNYVRDKVLGRV